MLGCCTGGIEPPAIAPPPQFETWCSNYPGCVAAGMSHGACCPNSTGSIQSCCKEGSSIAFERAKVPVSTECKAHQKCVKLGLTMGQCCPNLAGTWLPCCVANE